MRYEDLLAKAPLNHFSKEFLLFLHEQNKVVYEDEFWLVLRNVKYDKKEAPWLTAFFKKAPHKWAEHISPIQEIWGDWEWIKKARSKQTVKLFHFHLIKK